MKYFVNLMSEKAKLRECVRAQLYLWMMIWLSLVVMLVGVAVYLQFMARGTQRELERMELSYEPIAALTKSNKAIQQQIETINTEQEFVLALADQQSIVPLLGVVSQALHPEREELFFETLRVQQECDLELNEEELKGKLEISGITRDKSAVGRFVQAMAQSSPLDPLDVVNMSERTVKHTTVHQFTIRGSY